MNGVEPAAALFGDEDPASDPFATLGEDLAANKDSAASQQHSENVNTLFPGSDTAEFLAAADSSSKAAVTGPYTNPTDSANATFNESTYSANSWGSSKQFPVTQHTNYQQSSSPGYDQYAPVSTQGGGVQNPAYSHATHSNHADYSYTSAYIQPVHPQSEYSQGSTYSQPNTQQVGTYTQPSYDPYAPTQAVTAYMKDLNSTANSSHNPYAPPQTTAIPYAPQQTTTTPYLPQQTTTTSQYAPSYSAPSIGTTTSAPPPRKATSPLSQERAPLNRPKVSNAYDPPFPPMPSSRRGTARAGSGVPNYGSYQSQPQPTPTPPPPLQHPGPGVPGYGGYQTQPQSTSTPPPPPQHAISGVPIYGGHQSQAQPIATPPTPSQPPSSALYTTTYTARYSHLNITSHSQLPPISQGVSSQVNQHTTSFSAPPQPAAQHESGAYFDAHVGHPLERPPSTTNFANIEHIKPALEAKALTPVTSVEESSTAFFDGTVSDQMFTSGISSPPMPPPREIVASQNSIGSPTKRPYSRASLTSAHNRQGSLDRYEANSSPSPQLNGVHTSDTNKKGPLNTHLPPSRASSPQAMFDPYAPKGNKVANVYGVERTTSPSSVSIKSAGGHQSTKPNHVGPPKAVGVESPPTRPARSMSNGSIYSLPAEDPPVHGKSPLREPDRGHTNLYSWSNYDPSVTQEVIVKPLSSTYAPSPSLIGANDPLGRTSARPPVFSFGFGGKLVSCFHSAGTLNTGFDVALSARNTTAITIRTLKDVIPDSALDVSTSYPGPLMSDPGPVAVGIVRPGAATQIKNKKASVTKYLDERCDETSRGLNYLSAGSDERRAASGKLILIKLLKIMIENDGRLTGSSQIDTAVRTALVPRLEGDLPDTNNSAVPAYTLSENRDVVHLNEAPVSVITVRPSALNKIQNFLLHGERRKAYHYALDEKLWAHAMIISSSIDKDAWKEVVNEFLKNELGAKEESTPTLHPNDGENSTSSGRYESLRIAYSLFSGQGAAAVQELIPPNVISRPSGALLQPAAAIPQLTPRTPNFAPTSSGSIPPESLSTWAETAAMIISSPLSLESSAALTSLGDQLLANQWIEAAHACYLLSPQTSAWGGVGNPAARIVLVGSRNPSVYPVFGKDEDALILSEIAEFALSLVPVPKGQESFTGLPHLQAYRFLRAVRLAELGHVQLAGRYCEAITVSLTRGSPYFTVPLLEQLKGLADHISGISHADKSGSWMGGKISKPSLDTIGGWFENRFTKLVTGDADTPTEVRPEGQKPEDRSFAGPFSHYSTISSTPSARSSPQPTTVNLHVLPHRTGSAMSMSAYAPPQLDKTSYIADYSKQRSSPGPYPPAGVTNNPYELSASVNDTTTSFRETSKHSNEDFTTPKASNEDRESDDPVQEVGWWGSSLYTDTSNTRTPTTATFMQVDPSALGSSSDGFISLMDTQLSVTSPTKNDYSATSKYADDEDDDLGLGNAKPKPEPEPATSSPKAEQAAPSVPVEKPAAPERPELKPNPAASGSWLSRWWKRDTATPGPVKASLGEENAFYYDKDLKRWVNKKAGAEEASKPALPPPPPSRAQTASPGMTGPRAAPPSPAMNSQRSASAIDLTTSPPSKPAMRIRSNLVPPPESAPSTPTGSRLTVQGPPPGRPKSQASARRNARSRYVDIFAQENGGA